MHNHCTNRHKNVRFDRRLEFGEVAVELGAANNRRFCHDVSLPKLWIRGPVEGVLTRHLRSIAGGRKRLKLRQSATSVIAFGRITRYSESAQIRRPSRPGSPRSGKLHPTRQTRNWTVSRLHFGKRAYFNAYGGTQRVPR